MTAQPINNENQPVLESEKPRLPYQPPSLTILEYCDIRGGFDLIPEASNGIVS